MEDWEINLDSPPTRNAGEAIDNVRQAAMIAKRDPQRRGNVLHLPRKGELIITGDMHGCRENFERIVKFVALGRNPNRHLVLHELEHGGPRDEQGGCRSFELLEEAARLMVMFPQQVHLLLGNHDVAEMLNIQLLKGAVNMTRKFWEGLVHAYGPQAAEVKEAYCEFFKSLPLGVKTANGVWISHSTPHLDALADFDYTILDRPLGEDDFTRESHLYTFLWGRNQDEMAAKMFAEHVGCHTLVVGHQPSQMGYKIPNNFHIVIYSDNQLGRYLVVPLDGPLSHYDLSRKIQKIADLPR